MTVAEARGRFDWFDLMTDDPAGAEAFYSAVVGWTTQKWEGASMDYTMWLAADGPVGGFMKLPPQAKEMGAPTHWLGYVVVPDVDATARAFADAGGQVYMPPTDMPDVGRVSTVSDPWGAVIGLFHPAGEVKGGDAARGPGRIAWCEVESDDSAEALAFYGKVFGWIASDEMDMGPGGIYRMFKRPGQEFAMGGMMNRGGMMPVAAWTYYITVADLDAALATVAERGGEVLNGPMEVPGGDRVAQCCDPQGGMFALHSKG